MFATRYIVFNTVYAVSGLTLAMLAVLALLCAFPSAA